MSGNKHTSEKEENLFNAILYKFIPFWPLFVGLLIICLLGAWFYMKFKTPLYQITATLIIKDENKGVDDSKIMESINVFKSKKIVENEIEVIHSRTLMNEVVKDLYLYAPIYEKGKIKSRSAYTTSPIKIELKDPKNITFDPDDDPKVYFTYSDSKKQISFKGKSYPVGEWVKTSYGFMRFKKNDEQVSPPHNPLYFILIDPSAVTADLLSRLSVVATNKLSTVVNISLKDPNPKRGEDIVNHLIKAYNRSSIKERNSLAANTMDFIEERMKQVESELDELEKEEQMYRSTKGVIDLSEQGKFYLQNVGEYDRKIADINLQLAILDKVKTYVLSKDNKGGIVPSTLGINDPVLSKLLEKLYDSEIEYEKLSKTTAENNPVLQSIKNEIEKIRPSILENIQNQRTNLLQSRQNLYGTYGKYDSALQKIPQREREMLEISRRKATKSKLFSYLLQKREETALFYAPNSGDSRVVDMAESSLWPVSPNPMLVYAMAIFLAIGAGISYVSGKEFLSGKVLFRSEIEENTQVPIISELPNIKHKKSKLFSEPKEEMIIENFRQLRAKLGLYSRTFNKKTILVTSSISGEGKSFVSNHLAYSLAQSGKRVALLDMDFRKPNTSQLFGLTKHTGVVDFLTDSANYEEIINRSRVSNNLFIIPAGSEIGDHTELLLNGKLEFLFEKLNNDMDYLVIDSAPIDLVSDVNIIAEFTDKTLLVVRHNHTPRVVVKRFEQSDKLKPLRDVSIVFNGVRSRGLIKSNYGYGYGYEYNYKMAYQR